MSDGAKLIAAGVFLVAFVIVLTVVLTVQGKCQFEERETGRYYVCQVTHPSDEGGRDV